MNPPGRADPPHGPMYLIEGAGLCVFMVVAGVAATFLEAPGSALHLLIGNALLRRVLMGLAMGGTAMALIYSPWGARSGAHFNPAVTLAFTALGKVSPRDALGYMAAQCVGGTAGVLLVAALLGHAFTAPPVDYIATVPGPGGSARAFGAEFAISFLLMGVSLYASNRASLMRFTGFACGVLIVLYVTFEAPYSGMSMNPARTLASALPSGIWTAAWIYFSAPVTGMLAAAALYRSLFPAPHVACAKLNHDIDEPCIFRCHFAQHGIHVPSLIRSAAHKETITP